MRLLILGGTLYLGRHLAEQALDRGHSVSLFHRGQTGADLFPDAEHMIGDREGDLSTLLGGSWDAAIDTSGYVPRLVAASSSVLADRVEHLTFVSSVSVYADHSVIGLDEEAPVASLEDSSAEEVTGETYGPLKALSERAAVDAMPGRALVVRPGLIVGPWDPTERFTWWLRRLDRGGDVLAPGDPTRFVQFIDVRDLAAWILDMAEARTTGTFNATGVPDTLTMGALLETCRSVAGSDARFVWVPDEKLVEAGVESYQGLPLWIPASETEYAGFQRTNVTRALAAGLRFRPIEETARDTLAWAREVPDGRAVGSSSALPPEAPGLAPEVEAELVRDGTEIALTFAPSPARLGEGLAAALNECLPTGFLASFQAGSVRVIDPDGDVSETDIGWLLEKDHDAAQVERAAVATLESAQDSVASWLTDPWPADDEGGMPTAYTELSGGTLRLGFRGASATIELPPIALCD